MIGNLVRSSASRRTLLVTLVAVLTIAALGGSHVVLAAQNGTSDQELIDALVAVEEDLAGIPLLPDVAVSENETWATIAGDFVGPAVLLAETDADLAALVASASATQGAVADAVETVAAAYRTMGQGYFYLGEYERAGLARPAVQDDDAVSPGAVDEERGHAEIGLTLLLESLPGLQDGYSVLRDSEAAGSAQAVFENRFVAVQRAARTEVADVRTALSFPSTHLVTTVTRFESRFGAATPAQVARYVCVDAEDYLELRSQGVAADLPVPEGEQEDLPVQDCPALDNGNDVRLIEPGA